MEKTVRTRIAPSPTGIAHLGTAYQALRDYALARQHKGAFIVRIEDTDRERYVPGAVKVIFEAFAWLGLQNDEGPNVGGPYAPYTQSERLDVYHKYAQELVDNGKAYHCFCTKERLEKVRQEQQAKGELPRYDKHCRNLSPNEVEENIRSGTPHVVRLAVPESGKTVFNDLVRGRIEFENQGVDDQVLLKSDGFPTYHLAVVVDDYLMKITHVIRGEEWISSTPKHILLYEAFGWDMPFFAHLPIIRNKDKSKMSKRKQDVSILSYRDKGYLPEALNNFLSLMGWSHPDKKEVFSMEEFIKLFSLERVPTTAPIFDLDKLNWLNGIYIRQLSLDELFAKIKPFIPEDCPPELAKQVLPLIQERLVTLTDFEELASFFFREISYDRSLLLKKSATDQLISTQLQETAQALQDTDEKFWKTEELETRVRALAEKNNWKPGQYFMMLRIAVTGRTATPPLFETMEVLGKDKTLTRINQAL